MKPFWIYGIHAVTAALQNEGRKKLKGMATTEGLQKLGLAWPKAVPLQMAAGKDLDRVVGQGAVHQGVAVQVLPLEGLDICDIPGIMAKKTVRLMLLDQVTDPHNVGAILRSCAAFDVDALILPQAHAPEETGALAKAASGALELVPMIYAKNLAQAMRDLKDMGVWLMGLSEHAAQSLRTQDLSGHLGVVMGAEGQGLRRLTAELCDYNVRLPVSAAFQTLNVSTAAAITLYEVFCQNLPQVK